MADLSFSEISKLLKYDPETGKLFWLSRPREMFKTEGDWRRWNTKLSGREAFTASNGSDGHQRGRLAGKNYYAHRIAWVLHFGVWPSGDIDHIDGDTSNNKISNLRDVPHAINLRNTKRHSTNASGATGVSWHPQSGRWRASIHMHGKRVSLGLYQSIEQAIEARQAANERHGFTKRHGV